MSSQGNGWVATPRQYRPTQSQIPCAPSMANLGSPVRNLPTQQPNGRRRRTTSSFHALDLHHGAPTVASSGFTASVFNNDISHPTPQRQRLSFQPKDRKSTLTPSRIPTPNFQVTNPSPVRITSTPVIPTRNKENAPTTHRLLGPIQPGPPPNTSLTKSRTMNVISNLTSSFSRSTHNITSSRPSLGNLSAFATTSTCLPHPIFAPSIRQVSTTMPSTYWLGRFQALHDHFKAENLTPDFLDSPNLRHLMRQQGDLFDSTSNTECASPCRVEERVSKRVFAHLESLCVTNEARKSLKAFQQAYARRFECEALLPPGGSMVDREPGFISKAGRLFSGGRLSSFGISRRKSVLGLGVENAGPGR